MSADGAEITATADALRHLKAELGDAYWQDRRVIDLQDALRRLIGREGAWGEDRLPMHQRARRAARHEQAFARLLWPGGEDD